MFYVLHFLIFYGFDGYGHECVYLILCVPICLTFYRLNLGGYGGFILVVDRRVGVRNISSFFNALFVFIVVFRFPFYPSFGFGYLVNVFASCTFPFFYCFMVLGHRCFFDLSRFTCSFVCVHRQIFWASPPTLYFKYALERFGLVNITSPLNFAKISSGVGIG